MNRTIITPITAALGVLFAVVAAPLAALAQEFVKVDGSASQEVPAVPFVGIAYGFIWIAVLVYVLALARGLGRVRGELEDLRRKLNGGGSSGGAPRPRP